MSPKRPLLLLLAASSLLGLAGPSRADDTPLKALLVLSKGETTLSIVDPVSLRVVARMPAGPDPHEVVASSDGRLAFISNYGGGIYNTLTVVDLVGQKTLPSIDLGPLKGPHGLVFVKGKVFFTAEAAKAVGSYDLASNKVDFVLGTGQDRTHMIFVFDNLARMVTSNVSSATLSLIEKVHPSPPPPPPPGMDANAARMPVPMRPREDWAEVVVDVGKGAEGFDVSPGGKEAWVANAQDGTISIVDLEAKKVVETLAANVAGANRLKFTPDGKLALVSSLRAPTVAVFDAATRAEVKRVEVGHGAAGIQMEPSGERAYVACTPDDYVAVIDLKALEVRGHIDAGQQPDGLAWAVRR